MTTKTAQSIAARKRANQSMADKIDQGGQYILVLVLFGVSLLVALNQLGQLVFSALWK